MDLQTGAVAEESVRVRKCLLGDPAALEDLRSQYHKLLRSVLLCRGASMTEAEDILADLWGDCVPAVDNRPVLLEKYSGRCPLQSWLSTVAMRRWIDLKRRQAHCVTVHLERGGRESEALFEHWSADPVDSSEIALQDLLRESLRAAVDRRRPEELVWLRLLYFYGVTQREIARMLGWHESKVSRALSRTLQRIAADMLFEIRKRDPWLELTWQDFLDLCQARTGGFAECNPVFAQAV